VMCNAPQDAHDMRAFIVQKFLSLV
jgi:hypothetical protein